MSWFWFLVWLLLSAVLLGSFLWSTRILFRQKQAWADAAKRLNLKYIKGTTFGPPGMEGKIGDYTIAFFTAERRADDMRGRRYVSALDIQLPAGLVDGGAAGTPEMLPFMQTMSAVHPFMVPFAEWDKANSVYIRDNAVFEAYLTPERADHMNRLLKTKNADTLLLFDDQQAVIRLETADPLLDPEKMERILSQLITHSNHLLISPDERRACMALMKRTPESQSTTEDQNPPSNSG